MRNKLWTVDFTVNAAANFLIYLVYYFLMVIMTSYAVGKLHATHSQAGLATGIFIFGGLVARLVAGRAIGTLGEKKTLFIGLAVYLATTFLYFPVHDLFSLCAVRFLHGVGFGVSATGAGTIAARIIPSERRGEGISYYALSMTLASAVGPFVGMRLNQGGHFNIILVLSVALLLLSFIAAFIVRVPANDAVPPAPEGAGAGRLRVEDFLERSAIPISVICALVVLGFSGILAFLTPFAEESHLTAAGHSFFLVYSLFVLVSRPITGRLFDVRGENFITYPAILLFAAGLLLLALAHGPAALLAAAAVIGFGYGTFFSCANAIAVKVAHRDKIHLSTSTYFVFADLGAGAGPFLLGFMVPLLGFRGLYLALSGFVLCCVIFYYFAHGAKAARAAVASE